MQKFFKWAKKNLFLIIVVFLYAFLEFFHLGNFSAPQTFHVFNPGDELFIVLPSEQKVSKILLYVGPSYGDTNISYTHSYGNNDNKCGVCNDVENIIDNDKKYADYSSFKLDGGFKWKELPVDRFTSIIKIKANQEEYKNLWIGEIGVLDLSGNFINDIKVGLSSYSVLNSVEDAPEIVDEQNVVPKVYDMMNSSYFDEIYFAETAYQYTHGIVGYETVHPPLGKIIQSIPIAITGKMTPFTWRCMGALTGIFIIIAIYFLALEIFHESKDKEKYAKITLALSALSTLILTQTRLGTVDSYLCLFTILSYLFMLRFIHNPKSIRWLILSGLFFGCAFSVKWTGAFIGIGLAILYLSRNRFENIRKWIGYGAVFFVAVPIIIYFSCYLLFPKTTQAENVRDVVDQGSFLYSYHSTEYRPHPAQSKWYTWPIGLVPFYYALGIYDSRIILTSNYVISYTSIIALLVTLYFALKKHDKASLYIIIGFLALWLPYALISRPMFLYHYLSASCLSIVAIANMLRLLLPKSKTAPILIIGAAFVVFLILFPTTMGL